MGFPQLIMEDWLGWLAGWLMADSPIPRKMCEWLVVSLALSLCPSLAVSIIHPN